MKRKHRLLIVILVVPALVLWSPWINGQYAKERAVAEFERAWLNVADGCGAVTWKKVPFGAQVTLEYACGMLPADSPEDHRQANVYVSSLDMVYGLPTP